MVSRHTQQVLPGATATRTGTTRVQSVERAAALLRALASASGSSATATALAEAVGLNRTTTWRILATLEHQRLVSLDRSTGSYSLGFGLIDLAEQAGGASLARSARGVLQRIAAQTGETAALAVMRGGGLTYVAESVAGAVVSATWQGRAVPLHATSTGKVLLAHADPTELRELLALPPGGRLPRFTPTTVTSLAVLKKELALARERGFAVCRGEYENSAWGVSAPVLDVAGRPAAVLSIWGPGERLTETRFDGLGEIAMAGAEEIAGRRRRR